MSRRQQTRHKQVGRRQRKHNPRQKLIEQVESTEQQLRTAYRDHKKAVRAAQEAGVWPLDEPLKCDVVVKPKALNFYVGGFERDDRNHTVLTLESELSKECLTELAEKATNGRVTYYRPLKQDKGYWNYPLTSDSSLAAD